MSETQVTIICMHEHTHKTTIMQEIREDIMWSATMCNSKHTSQQPQNETEISCGPSKTESFIFAARL